MSSQTSFEKAPAALPVNFTGEAGRGKADQSIPAEISTKNSLNEILIFARNQVASDVHIGGQKPIIFRQFGRLKTITTDLLTDEAVSSLISTALPKELVEHFEKTGDIEFVHTINGYGRYRIAMMKQRNGWDLTARVIPMDIPKFESTGMPDSCAALTKWAQGMVLVSGPAGCGKTTTLAVLVELVNQSRHDHIITIEEPIEIVYEPKQCQVTQREINTHTLSQAAALRAALREDPDILVVSELRDLSSIQLAVSAAETGHLVFGTMNTVNAIQTISCLIDSFPAEEQSIVRNMISESLRGVICQQLVPRKDGKGMVPAYEVLVVTPPVANLIRANKMTQINNAIVTSKNLGMILMDTSLEMLAKKEIITTEEACDRAISSTSMLQSITRPKTISKMKLLELVSNKEVIINQLLQIGVIEESSPMEFRLKPNAELTPDIIRMITRDDFDKVWAALQQLIPQATAA